MFGWGSNKYGQILPADWAKGVMKPTKLRMVMEEGDRLIASSYFTLLLTRRTNPAALFASQPEK